MKTQPKVSQWVMMGSGLVTLIFSFLAFYKFGVDGFGSKSYSAWSTDAFFPLSTIPAIFGILVAGAVAAEVFGNMKLPEEILTFNKVQALFVLAFTSAMIMIGFLLVSTTGASKGIGFWFMLLGSLGLVAGTVMELTGAGGGTMGSAGGGSSQAGPTTPF